MKKSIDKKKLGDTSTEAWADQEKLKKETNVNIPSEQAVEDAKEWVEENEK